MRILLFMLAFALLNPFGEGSSIVNSDFNGDGFDDLAIGIWLEDLET
jgi:FG-GAP repeat